MSDRELLDRIRAVVAELDLLIEAAGHNTKYHTEMILKRARLEVVQADSALVWYVEG